MPFFDMTLKENNNISPFARQISDRPKIIEKFSQSADENGHVLLPGPLPGPPFSFYIRDLEKI